MQRLQDPKQNNVDNLDTVSREADRHSTNKKKEYLKAKIDELKKNSKIKISETCKGTKISLRRFTSKELTQ